jgi:hypothetical protein
LDHAKLALRSMVQAIGDRRKAGLHRGRAAAGSHHAELARSFLGHLRHRNRRDREFGIEFPQSLGDLVSQARIIPAARHEADGDAPGPVLR